MGKNSTVRNLLSMKYGKGCMFKRAKIAERLEKIGGIKTYKTFIKERRYTRKKIKKLEESITFHHLTHVSENRTYN